MFFLEIKPNGISLHSEKLKALKIFSENILSLSINLLFLFFKSFFALNKSWQTAVLGLPGVA